MRLLSCQIGYIRLSDGGGGGGGGDAGVLYLPPSFFS